MRMLRGGWSVVLTGPVLVLLALTPGVRADSLDPPLAGHGHGILQTLRDHKVKNVGVLPFRVQKGARPVSFLAGPINAGMATRVENALIMNLPEDEKQAIGVVRHAAATAARARVGEWYSKPAERKKLFDHDYPLAWGTKTVRPDAFITGLIQNVGNRETTKVTVEVFYKTNPQKFEVLEEFTIDTDRSVLADLGYNFALSRSAAGKTRSGKERDKIAASLVRRRDEGQPVPPAEGERVTPGNIHGLTVKVQYDGNEQAIKPFSESGQSQEYYILPIKAGTRFTLSLTYNGTRDDKLGAIVKVNGLSTWQGQTGDSLNLQKWIYAKETHLGKPDLMKGIYTDVEGKNLRPFTVVTGAEAEALASQLERAGYIDIDVFESGPPDNPNPDERMRISTRSLSRGPKPTRPNSPGEARSQLLQANFVRLRTARDVKDKGKGPRVGVRGSDSEGGMLTASEEAVAAGRIEQGLLPNPRLVGHLTIKYYDALRTPMTISK